MELPCCLCYLGSSGSKYPRYINRDGFILGGFIAYLGVKILVKFPQWILRLYDWAWFTAFGISFFLYLIVNIKNPHYKRNEEMYIQSMIQKEKEEVAKAEGTADRK